MAETPKAAPKFDFDVDPSIVSLRVPMQTYLAQNPINKIHLNFLAVGAYVIDSSTPQRILLVQRAASDSMPGRWEVPGGACDDEDPTVLHGVARELWEESGLHASRIGPQIGDGHVFATRSGRIVCKFGFLIEPHTSKDEPLSVRLDPQEHQNYVWASEEEVKAYKAGIIDLTFTHEEQQQAIMKAFEAKRQLG